LPDLFDYLTWRGDIPMTQVPLCPVDCHVLSALVYVQFHDILPAGLSGTVTVGQAAKAYLARPQDQRGPVRVKADLSLLEAIQKAPRFSELGLCFYDDRFVPEEEMQFAAMAVLLGDGSAALIFRGTDSTMVGWKEDFNMSFMDSVPAQRAAVEYAERFAAQFCGPITLAGHSKGGNLAVYAAANCQPRVRDRIRCVYNLDGPGFPAVFLECPGYQEMLPRIHTFVPQSSIFGMMLEHEETYTVVKSRHIGVFQHDPYTWEILGGDFVRLEEVTAGSRIFDRTAKAWIAQLSPADRSTLVDAIFDLITAGDVDHTDELLRPASLLAALKALKDTDDKTRRLMADSLARFLRTAVSTVKENLRERE